MGKVIVLIFFLFASRVSAEPMLICDPYDVEESGISSFGVIVDYSGVTQEIPYSEHSSGAAIVYRGGVLNDDGVHHFKVWAISQQAGRHSETVPFTLFGVLNTPSNIGFRPW